MSILTIENQIYTQLTVRQQTETLRWMKTAAQNGEQGRPIVLGKQKYAYMVYVCVTRNKKSRSLGQSQRTWRERRWSPWSPKLSQPSWADCKVSYHTCVLGWMFVLFLSLLPRFCPKAKNLFALQPTGQGVAGTGQTCSKPVWLSLWYMQPPDFLSEKWCTMCHSLSCVVLAV